MSKAYSNKALPAGTVLREWRLEQVLGVGGFGIVYKGRGIYFNELVAIKEYFPSAISERQEGDTVVPIDSDAEEVHALGLKKFVEEAKLLWNLSTPTRHPNIVSVRSLFEVHGTAYMVMDFEDGVSLSKLIKEGKRFSEESLMALVQPIAEGLDRAHRVGVLHRDIKPPNILINPDGRPVLIDFGSARFESAEATNTKVTFHTPPYAAIEQYVKTYEQGPWTDIYALGVVLYECVTGEKPPEVLERLHGGLGTPLAEQDLPGYSPRFLKAVDAAMIIRPSDRPQSIPQWMAMFDEDAPEQDGPDDDATRFVPFESITQKIEPVTSADLPPLPVSVDVPIPDDVSEVRFKRAGEDTDVSRVEAFAEAAAETTPPHHVAEPQESMENPAPEDANIPPPPPTSSLTPASRRSSGRGKTLWLAGGALAVSAAAAIGFMSMGGPHETLTAPSEITDAGSIPTVNMVDPSAPAQGQPASPIDALVEDARRAGVPNSALQRLAQAQAQLSSVPAPADTASIIQSAGAAFASALSNDATAKMQRIARDVPWASGGANALPANQANEGAKLLQAMQRAKAGLASTVPAAGSAKDPQQAMTLAHSALAEWTSFSGSRARAIRLSKTSGSNNTDPALAADLSKTPDTADAKDPAKNTGSEKSAISASRLKKFSSVVVSARDTANDVIDLGKKAKTNRDSTDDEKKNYKTLTQNMKAAKGYLDYLDGLEKMMVSAEDNDEADGIIKRASETKGYLVTMLSRSSAAAR